MGSDKYVDRIKAAAVTLGQSCEINELGGTLKSIRGLTLIVSLLKRACFGFFYFILFSPVDFTSKALRYNIG